LRFFWLLVSKELTMPFAATEFTTDQERWEAVASRDRRADGAFVYAVRTTGVYCRPSCASRQPHRANVQFFDTGAEAEGAGFRPCKRCSPQEAEASNPHTEMIKRACVLIEQADRAPRLEDLARVVGLSPSHFHRLFRALVGVTPHQYATTHRANRVRERLAQDATVTEAIYNAGFESSSRFYAQGTDTLGMTASEFRNGAEGQQIRYALAECYLGWVLVAATGRGICTIDFADEPVLLRERLQARFPRAELRDGEASFTAWVAEVVRFLEAPGRGLDLPLDIQGTAFQRRVWLELRDIPAGSTASYTAVAARIGQPEAVRAVAQACAANTLAVAIPCHRVVRSNGELSGYRWGVARKRALLEREAAANTSE
jgi:AraC family transcriptional regulator of adaptative response/methylated-DNA-[protein]-cysteine methyltransferase